MSTKGIKIKAVIATVIAAAAIASIAIYKAPDSIRARLSSIATPEPSKALVVAPSGAVIRALPDKSADKVGSLQFLTYVDIKGDNSEEDKWYRVANGNGEGWVYGKLLADKNSPAYMEEAPLIDKELELVKGLRLSYFGDRVYLYDGLNSLGGAMGETNWKVYKPSFRIDDKPIILVRGTTQYSQKSFMKGTTERNYLELILAVNTDNGQFDFMKAQQNGKPLSKLEMMLMFGAKNGFQ